MIASDARTARLGLWVLLLVSLFALAPTTFPGYWQTLDGFVPILNVSHSGAIANVATTPDLWRGTGRGAFLLAQPLLLLGASPVEAVRISLGLALLLGGLGIYGWLAPRFGDRMAGLAGVIYLLLPPVLATLYLRGSLADAWILALLPVALAGLAAYVEGRSLSSAAVVVLSMLWMWRIQAGLAVWATLLLIAYAAWVERSRLAMLVAGLSGAAGLAGLIPIWAIHGPAPVNFADHFLVLGQLLYGDWQIAPSIPGPHDGYPFQVGIAALSFALTALWLWSRQITGDRLLGRLLAFSSITVTVLLLLTLNIAAPLWALTGVDRLLSYPWQLLLLAGPLLAVLGGSLPALNPALGRAPLWVILAGVALLSSYPYLQPTYTTLLPPAAPVATLGLRPDLVVLEAVLVEEPATLAPTSTTTPTLTSALTHTLTSTLTITWQVLHPLPFDYSVFFQAVAATPDGDQVLAQVDTQPLQGTTPATSWLPGEIFTDTYVLTVPVPAPMAAPAGDPAAAAGQVSQIRYFFGLYDWRDGSRMPVNGGLDNKLILYGN
jgi:hypothetical protein